MVNYVYYNPGTMQVEAEFNTPNLAVQTSWADKGLSRAVVPAGMTVDDAYIYHAGSSIATTGITTVTVTAATGSGVDKAWNHVAAFGDQ